MNSVDFLPKTFLILYPCLENSTTGNAIVFRVLGMYNFGKCLYNFPWHFRYQKITHVAKLFHSKVITIIIISSKYTLVPRHSTLAEIDRSHAPKTFGLSLMLQVWLWWYGFPWFFEKSSEECNTEGYCLMQLLGLGKSRISQI